MTANYIRHTLYNANHIGNMASQDNNQAFSSIHGQYYNRSSH